MLSLARFICRARGTQSEDEQFVAQIHRFMLRSCRLIFWHDRRVAWPREIRGGSGFVLRFGQRLIGVTAAHVVETYRAAVSQTPSLVVQLDNAEFDLLGALIDEDEELDLATFAVAQHQLTPEAAIFDCSMQWPPPDPERGKPVSLIGFPEVLRRPVGRDMSATLGAYGAFALVEDCTDREIIIVYDPSKEQPLAGIRKSFLPRGST
jgi:hypothetical protein